MKMRFFDLHCDTAGECFLQKKSLYDGELHINLCKGELLDNWAQLFAFWIPDEKRGKAAEEYFDTLFSNFENEVGKNADKVLICRDISDYEKAVNERKCAAIVTVEGASPAVSPGRLEYLKSKGVKLITLTWNGENEVGCGAVTGEDKGLTPAGVSLAKEMSRLGIVADVSHLNRKGFFELCEISDGPVIASHSDCADLLRADDRDWPGKPQAVRRSIDDNQIKVLIRRKGLLGINFCDAFLGPRGDDGFDAVRRHMDHVLSLGGEDILSVGSDFDGCTINSEMDSLTKIPALYDYLSRHGFDDALLDKIFWSNADSFFRKILQ